MLPQNVPEFGHYSLRRKTKKGKKVRTWLSGTRVRIIVSATHLLVVEPAYYTQSIILSRDRIILEKWHCSMIGCGLTLMQKSVPRR